MTTKPKQPLRHEQKHILKLIAKDANSDGWASVSEQLYKVLSSNVPTELTTFERLESGGRARLTEEGQGVIRSLQWLE